MSPAIAAPVLTPRLADALNYALIVHAGQLRKGTAIPYAAHLLGVCSLVLDFGGDEDQAMAGLLHDAVEDGGQGHGPQIRARFGALVADMVQACTDGTVESKAAEKLSDPIEGWRRRKEGYLGHLRDRPSTDAALLVSACDKLHNARAILSDLRCHGDEIFARFTAGRDGTLWYYAQIAEIFEAHGSPVADELRRTVEAIKANAGSAS